MNSSLKYTWAKSFFTKNKLSSPISLMHSKSFMSITCVLTLFLGSYVLLAHAPHAKAQQTVTPTTHVNVNAAQTPAPTSANPTAQSPQKNTVQQTQSAQTAQNGQAPITMTVSTTINNPQTLVAPQTQTVNMPNTQTVNVPINTQTQVAPQQKAGLLPRSTYGITCAPSLERNIYLNSVWDTLVPRRQIYEDPARKMQKPRSGRGVASRGKTTNTKPNTTQKTTETSVSAQDKLKLESGSHVLIQPGAHVTVWADDEKTTPNPAPNNTGNNSGNNTADTPNSGNTQNTANTTPVNINDDVVNNQGASTQNANNPSITNPNLNTPNINAPNPSGQAPDSRDMNFNNDTNNTNTTNNTGNAPFVANETQNPDIPALTVPTPNGLPTAEVGVEPSFGN